LVTNVLENLATNIDTGKTRPKKKGREKETRPTSSLEAFDASQTIILVTLNLSVQESVEPWKRTAQQRHK
jgi:hypothetical protein